MQEIDDNDIHITDRTYCLSKNKKTGRSERLRACRKSEVTKSETLWSFHLKRLTKINRETGEHAKIAMSFPRRLRSGGKQEIDVVH